MLYFCNNPINHLPVFFLLSEKGRFLAIDLGGANFRILLITLGPEKSKCRVESRVYAFPEEKMQGTADEVSTDVHKNPSLHKMYIFNIACSGGRVLITKKTKKVCKRVSVHKFLAQQVDTISFN